MQYHDMTAAGVAALHAEVAALKAARPAKIKALAAAAALGDRSENADYTTAKRELRQLEGRLRYLDKLIRYAQVVTPDASPAADIGKWVTVAFDDGTTEQYRLVGPHEASLAPANLASDSPLGRALMHQTPGATVTVQAPACAYAVTLMTVAGDMV
ncbi:transcription elongation factor GreA [Lacticaseibacillus daqingensis]|uniref:transcription elongation factor GreA n=1 Tax=Lacticaseibacillus daqingensis TaxID=2486014 RepID=UPI000F78DC4E|nr:transcription elongation factor GreA [Lacticaseibacillus daqingensis]